MTLPERFRRLRAHLKISARQMSSRIGCSSSLWTQYELGLKEPSTETLRRLIGLGFDLHWVLTGEGQMLRTAAAMEAADEAEPESPLQSLLEALGSLLDRYGGQTLLNLMDVVQVLEHNGEGLSEQQLHDALAQTQPLESVQQSLAQLKEEGIVVLSRGQFRLVRASIRDNSNTLTLRVLVSIYELLVSHYPALQQRPDRGKLLLYEVFAPSGLGVVRARDLGQRVNAWVATQAQYPVQTNDDRIRLVVSMIVQDASELRHE